MVLSADYFGPVFQLDLKAPFYIWLFYNGLDLLKFIGPGTVIKGKAFVIYGKVRYFDGPPVSYD